jgi:hypothetical protein
MKSTPAEIGHILAALEQTPHTLERIAAECSEAQLASAPGQGGWSAQEVLAHLRACADLWTQSIYAMLAEKDPVLADINERKYALAARYAEVPFMPALTEFRSQRANLLRVLTALKPEEWERGAVILGRSHTVFTQARRLAKHEGEHAGQLDALLK